MSTKLFRSLLAATCMSAAFAGSAYAGGFSRGTADTDIIFDDGNFNMRASMTYVSPTKKISKDADPALVGKDYAESYVIPSYSLKANLADDLRCAATMVDTNGGDANYEGRTTAGKLVESFTTNEKGLTCGYKFDLSKGRVWILGGAFVENFSYDRDEIVSTAVTTPAHLTLNGQDLGFRVGAAYEIPEIALRAQLMYRSATSYGAKGTLGVPTAAGYLQAAAGFAAAAQQAADGGNLALAGELQQKAIAAQQAAQQLDAAGATTPLDATGTGNLPQSVELKVQSGVAPGWLAFGSVKWMDWSVQQALIVNSAAGETKDLYNWKDGWTITGGVGHSFNDSVSGLAALTWDQGVGTGYDTTGDTWTMTLGASVKDKLGGQLQGGIGLTYIAASSETQYGADNRSTKAGYAIAGNIGYGIKW